MRRVGIVRWRVRAEGAPRGRRNWGIVIGMVVAAALEIVVPSPLDEFVWVPLPFCTATVGLLVWWLSIFVVFFCRAASGNPISREHTPRQKWAETRAVSWLHTAYSVTLNLLRIKDPRDGRWQMTKQAFPIQERLGKEPGLGLYLGE